MNPETEQLEEVQDRPVFTATTRLNAALQQEAATALTPTICSSGRRCATCSAAASSVPGSQSIQIGICFIYASSP